MDFTLEKAIEQWLEQICSSEAPLLFDSPCEWTDADRPTKKRKTNKQFQLPSPAQSAGSSTAARQRDNDGIMDPETPRKRKPEDETPEDDTPRPNKAASTTSSAFKDAPSLSSSQRSGRSSPVKTFPIYGEENHCISCQPLNPNQLDMPPALADLLREFMDIGEVYGVIPNYLKVGSIRSTLKQY